MAKIKKILTYLSHYGWRSTLGLIREKLLVDPKRFSARKRRTLPAFPQEYCRLSPPAAVEAFTPLSILYLIHYFYPTKKGGTERFTLNLAKAQQALGHRVCVLVLEANEPLSAYPHRFEDIYYRTYTYEGVDCIAFRHKKAPLGLYYKDVRTNDRGMQSFAAYLCRERDISVVHATYPQPFASFLHACRDMGVPYIVTCTDFCMMCHYSTMVDNHGDFCAGTCGQTKCQKTCKTYGCSDFRRRHANASAVLQGAAAVTVPSEFVARLLGAEFSGLPILPVAHGIGESFRFRKRQGKIKKFVYAGTLSTLKGVHLLLEAFVRLPGEVTLDIYGEGDDTYVSRLRSLADDRVTFHGAVPGSEMPRVYGEADCVIVPSMWYETYNFVFREAIATGSFVLNADIGAMSEGIDVGKNGYLFTPADGEDLYQKMRLAMEFDFKDYLPRTYPTVSGEGEIYERLYRAALETV